MPDPQEQVSEPQDTPAQKKPKPPLLNDVKVHLMAAVAGFVVASAVCVVSGNPVAWATPLYYLAGWPLMSLVVYLLSRGWPHNSWRWTVSMMLGQVFSSIFFGNANFVIQAVLFVTILSAPQFAAGVYGARAGRANQRPTQSVEGGHTDNTTQQRHTTADDSSQDQL